MEPRHTVSPNQGLARLFESACPDCR